MTVRALVLGAGVVGTSVAAHLCRQGFDVTLLDRSLPGAGCSSGNAGMLGTESSVPTALPGTILRIPKMLCARGPLALDWRFLPELLPWALRFAASARPSRVEAISRAMHAIQAPLLDAHLDLVRWSGAEDLIAAAGKVHVYQTAEAYEEDAPARDLMRARGADFEDVGPEETRELLPELERAPFRGLWFPKIRHCIDPQGLVAAYAGAGERAGVRFVQETAQAVVVENGRAAAVRTSTGERRFDILVVAMGAWSAALLRPLGVRVPLVGQRGYHIMLPEPGIVPSRPVKFEDRKIVVTKMRDGLRVTGIAELARLDSEARPQLATGLLDAARQLFPGLRQDAMSWWSGFRPSTPDSLPVIDRLPGHPNVLLAFGHGHWGFGLGAITGRLIAALASNASPGLDLGPYAVSRFQ
jgi:D-amino-acid dehydrogenase